MKKQLSLKIGMTQIFDEAGKVIPVTVVEAGLVLLFRKKLMRMMDMNQFN